MAISAFELFSIGVGPSSSHTVGPMRAARRFASLLESAGLLSTTASVTCRLYGSLGATGRGHGTDRAVIAGLAGVVPETANPVQMDQLLDTATTSRKLLLLEDKEISFFPDENLLFESKTHPVHCNTMVFSAVDAEGHRLLERTYCSVGGGFVVEAEAMEEAHSADEAVTVPYPFSSANELLEWCSKHSLPISAVVMENEKTWRTADEVRRGLVERWEVMQSCIAEGCRSQGFLPGALKIKRRAPGLLLELQRESMSGNPMNRMTWVDLWAIAVGEQNAAGGRVVTAPTNGAAGIIPAVLYYFHEFCTDDLSEEEKEEATVRFLLTATAIGQLFKLNASISGAEVGCQGEVGSACSMAAAGLTEVLGGTPSQVENAAEIGMEHNLGLTCDPIGGLVQVPCIERNAMAAVKAINSAQLALRGDGSHYVSLDKVIKTMRDTGRDMLSIYKETSQGGLAVNVTEC